MRALNYAEVLTGVDPDILAGSELEFAPGNGIYIIRAASTVNTATLAVNGVNGPVVSSARAITLRANGEIRSTDVAWIVPVEKGEKVIASIAGTTGTAYFTSQYLGES